MPFLLSLVICPHGPIFLFIYPSNIPSISLLQGGEWEPDQLPKWNSLLSLVNKSPIRELWLWLYFVQTNCDHALDDLNNWSWPRMYWLRDGWHWHWPELCNSDVDNEGKSWTSEFRSIFHLERLLLQRDMFPSEKVIAKKRDVSECFQKVGKRFLQKMNRISLSDKKAASDSEVLD